MKKALLGCIAIAAMALAGCVDSSTPILGSGGGGGGGGSSTTGIDLGVTDTGGAGNDLALQGITDPLLGTGGLLGGGNDGALGQLLPSTVMDPLANGLSTITTPLADALPIDQINSSLPALGVAGDGGLLADVLGQDPVGPLIGTNGTLVALLGGGNDGALGDLTGGGLPGLPGGGSGSNPLSPIADLLGGGLPGSGGLPGIDGLTLGVTGNGGLLADLIGQDPIGPALSPLGPVADLLDNGNSGLLGNILPAGGLAGGGLPGLPTGGAGGSNPVANVPVVGGILVGVIGAVPVPGN